ncbi:MAG: exosortase system-associated protein, TIGR04073 family [Verrucomicrobiales bacterium]|nr:exosortase system-associated protein, TIGR04073 family [Verrucomicrobiales bacterium]
MRSTLFSALILAVGASLVVGCKGPSKKLGRGVTNATEFARLGELRRSVEQEALWSGPQAAYSSGVINGINRSVLRTLVGVGEVLTFPIPSYEPWLKPGNPLIPDATVGPAFPDSYKPGLVADGVFETDSNLGFSGGDVAPLVPGSRFRIFDY